MPETLDAVFAFAVAAVIAWLLVPPVESIATRIGAIDEPNERSLHVLARPKLGGLAILIAALVAGAIWLPWDTETKAILGGAIAIAIVGVFDDIFDLPAAPKLLGQIVAVSIPVAAGVTVNDFTLPFVGRVEPSSVEVFSSLPLLGSVNAGEIATTLGIVAIVNAVNFADGVDGLAAGVCV
ncbi:MAG: glycosyltransferase family 4 protein, partial [Solirubrobacterales bacterium]